MGPILCQLNPVHNLILHIFKIHFNIILQSMPTFPSYLFPLDFLIFRVCISLMRATYPGHIIPLDFIIIIMVRFRVLTAPSMRMTVFWDVAPCSLLEVYFYQTTWRNIPEDSHPHRNHIWWRVAYNMKLLIMKLFPVHCYFSALTHKSVRKFQPSVPYLIKIRSAVSDMKCSEV
jgi:hypothetical protein